MRNGFRVIDADAHSQDAMAQWVDYMEPEYWDRRPRIEYVDGSGERAPRSYRLLPCELFPEPEKRTGNLQGAGVHREGRALIRDFMPKKYPTAIPSTGRPKAG